ncbi:N-acetylmuramoyl-L-alanine amidase [Candidatus Dependentiae bacterium]|nr:N-acetylmuramoyl-L-alanine amidase [Candidatus Dependentiae bacterium]
MIRSIRGNFLTPLFMLNFFVLSHIFATTNIERIEVSSDDIGIHLLFDFIRTTAVKSQYNDATQTLSLFFPLVSSHDLKNHNNWSQIVNLSQKGLTVELDEQDENEAGATLRLRFPKATTNEDENQFVVKWSNVNSIQWSNPDKSGNRFTVNVFSIKALKKINNSSTILCATNDVIQNDFSRMAGLPTKTIASRRIIIDAGHGGGDHGARGCHNTCEKEIALQVAKKLAQRLKSVGYNVHLTRNSDKNISLLKRCNLANQLKGDAFISIHLNSAGKIGSKSAGIETYYLSKTGILPPSHIGGYYFVNSDQDQSLIAAINKYIRNKIDSSKTLASCVQNQLISTLRKNKHQPKDRGVKPEHLRLLLHNNIPTTLVEIGFVTNPQEALKLKTPAYQDTLAAGISRGVQRFFDQQ